MLSGVFFIAAEYANVYGYHPSARRRESDGVFSNGRPLVRQERLGSEARLQNHQTGRRGLNGEHHGDNRSASCQIAHKIALYFFKFACEAVEGYEIKNSSKPKRKKIIIIIRIAANANTRLATLDTMNTFHIHFTERL